MKKLLLLLITFTLILPTIGWARSEYIFRQGVKWVKIKDADSKETPLNTIRQPFNQINTDQMEAMLLSIKISKKFVLKKEINTQDVFNAIEARQFAPYFVEALGKAGPDQVINFAVIHKRPAFILQNDRITLGNMWMAEDGLHLRFDKLFAKIEGDYQASAHTDKAIKKAKTLNVTLEANEGQKLSYASPMEVILDNHFGFIGSVATERAEEEAQEEENLKPQKYRKDTPSTYSTPVKSSPSERLKKLDELKKQNLITDKEYQDLRKKILSEI